MPKFESFQEITSDGPQLPKSDQDFKFEKVSKLVAPADTISVSTAETRRGVLGRLNEFVRSTALKYVFVLSVAMPEAMTAGPAQSKQVEKIPKSSVESIKITGMEELHPSLTPERLRVLLAETLPRGFADQIAAITYKDEEDFVDLGAVAGVKRLAREAAHVERQRQQEKANLVFVKGSQEAGPSETINTTLYHEIAHTQDWLTSGALNKEDRRWFRSSVVSRVNDPSRYYSDYVESIFDPNFQDGERAIEYWAEILSAYLGAEEPEVILSKADLDLLKAVLGKIDPTFDQAKALRRRRQLLGEMFKSVIDGGIDNDISRQKRLLMDWITQHQAERDTSRSLHKDKSELVARYHEGYAKLGELINSWADSPARKKFAFGFLRKQKRLADLLDNSFFRDLNKFGQEVFKRQQWLNRVIDKQGDDIIGHLEFQKQVEDIFETYHLYDAMADGETVAFADVVRLVDVGVKGEAQGWALVALELFGSEDLESSQSLVSVLRDSFETRHGQVKTFEDVFKTEP